MIPLGITATQDCPESAAVRARFTSLTNSEVRADGREQGWDHPLHNERWVDLCPNCRPEAAR